MALRGVPARTEHGAEDSPPRWIFRGQGRSHRAPTCRSLQGFAMSTLQMRSGSPDAIRERSVGTKIPGFHPGYWLVIMA